MKSRTVWLGLAGLLIGGLALFPVKARAGQENKKKGVVVELDGLKSQAPADWVEEEPSETSRRFRYKQFRLPEVKRDKDPAQLIIFYFGEGGGGGVEENIKRWKQMFVPPQGKTIDDVAKVEKMKVAGVAVTYLDVHGTYLFKARPFDPNAETVRRPNHRMMGVVFESEKGPYFIRLVGPAGTVAHYKKGFDDWLKGFK